MLYLEIPFKVSQPNLAQFLYHFYRFNERQPCYDLLNPPTHPHTRTTGQALCNGCRTTNQSALTSGPIYASSTGLPELDKANWGSGVSDVAYTAYQSVHLVYTALSEYWFMKEKLSSTMQQMAHFMGHKTKGRGGGEGWRLHELQCKTNQRVRRSHRRGKTSSSRTYSYIQMFSSPRDRDAALHRDGTATTVSLQQHKVRRVDYQLGTLSTGI